MELMLGVLWVAGVLWAGKHALQHVAAEYRKSRGAHAKQAASEKKRPAPRRHAAAWWAREAGHGFPVTRSGLHNGWLAHKAAMDQHRAQREEAKTSHLEARASIASEFAAHRERQAAAQAQIDKAHSEAVERYTNARRALDENAIRDHAAGIDEETPEFNRLNHDVVEAERGLARRDQARITRKSVRDLDYWNRMKESPSTAPAQEGNGHMATATETNYTTVTTAATTQAEQAEYAAADITRLRQQAEQIAEDMEAANVDSASIAEQMDHVAQLKAAEEALTAVTESGGAVVNGLQRRHGGIKEAVDDSPADPAEMGFYQE